MIRLIARNILSNWVAFGVSIAITFLLTPFIIHKLGDVTYGSWILITNIAGSYALFAIGLQSGVNQYLTRYYAQRNYEQMNAVASTAVSVMIGVALVIIAVSFLAACFASSLFEVPEHLQFDVFWCLIILGVTTAAQMVFYSFSATFTATQRFDLSSLIGITARLIGAALTIVALWQSWGVLGICLASAISYLLECLIHWRLAYAILPELSIRLAQASRSVLTKVLSYSSWSFVITIAQSLFLYADSFVIGATLPIAGLAYYSLAAGLVRNLEMLLVPIAQVFSPAATHLHAQDRSAALANVYLRASRLFLVAVSVVAVVAGFWAEDFYRLWVGEKFISGTGFPSVATLFLILLAAMCARLFPGIGSQILTASLRIRPLAIVSICEAASNVLLSIALSRSCGLVGVALGTLISTFVFRTFAIPCLLSKQTGVSLWGYVSTCASRPFLVAVGLSLAALGIRYWGSPPSFAILFVHGALALCIATPLVLFVGLNSCDRKQLVFEPATAAWQRRASR